MLLPKKHLRRALAFFALFASFSLVAPHPALAVDKDMAEIEHYTLTMDKITRLGQTFDDLGAYAKAHPDAKSSLETDADQHEDLDAITRRVSSIPEVVTILRKNGFSPREFVVLEMTYIQVSMAVAMKPANEPDDKYAAEVHMNPANLAFVRAHQEELKAMQARMSGDK